MSGYEGELAKEAGPILVQVGKAFWKAIIGNRPVRDTSNLASALPTGIAWEAVTGWFDCADVVQLRYRRTKFKVPVVNITLYHSWKGGGSYAGRGQYVKDAGCVGNGRGRFGEEVTVDVAVGGPEPEGPDPRSPVAALPMYVTVFHSGIARYALKVRGNRTYELDRLSPDAEHLEEVPDEEQK